MVMKGFAYIGCRTTKERNARGRGIKVYRIDGDQWTLLQVSEGQVNPSYLCLNREKTMLYAIHGDFSQVSAYRIGEDGCLTYGNTTDTHGTNPVHLILDRTEKWLFVANLQTGGVSVIPILEDGLLGHIRQLAFISGNGGPGYISHPHQTMTDRTGNWLIVPSQGRLQGVGKLTVFRVNSDQGKIEEAYARKSRTGAEPRHCVFHPNNRFCYCVNEKDSTVTFYEFDEKTGVLEPKQIVTSLPEDYAGDGWASAIDMEPSGRALYVSNRKHDSVTVYSLDPENGRMTMVQNVSTDGEQPRFITVSPDGSRLLAANEVSDTIKCFAIDSDGCLSDIGLTIATESPVCVAWNME